MALFEPPPTHSDPFIQQAGKEVFNPIWLRWFLKLVKLINDAGGPIGVLHNALNGLQGGTTAEYYHLTSARYSTITGTQPINYVFAGPASGGSAAPDFRPLDNADLPNVLVAGGPTGASATVPVITWNAKGLLTVVSTATITPGAIGAPSGSGSSTGTNTGDVTLAGTLTYITLVNQVITRNAIKLTTDVTEVLPAANGGAIQYSYYNLGGL